MQFIVWNCILMFLNIIFTNKVEFCKARGVIPIVVVLGRHLQAVVCAELISTIHAVWLPTSPVPIVYLIPRGNPVEAPLSTIVTAWCPNWRFHFCKLKKHFNTILYGTREILYQPKACIFKINKIDTVKSLIIIS